MKVEIVPAAPEEAPIVGNLMELYLYELSYLHGREIGEEGRYGYASLDAYWREPGHYPFLIRVDARLAGFALVMERPIVVAEGGHLMAEFFVLSSYRRRGVGEAAARALFDRFAGAWLVTEHERNEPAQAFWRVVISRYTGGDYREEVWRLREGEGAVAQKFESRPPLSAGP